MDSLRNLYRIGHGPSSSHTMGPQNASIVFLKKYPGADSFIVTLHGSLASTGKGHLTDVIIKETFKGKKLEIKWKNKPLAFHPNGMDFEAYGKDRKLLGKWRVYSIGGGALSEGKKGKKASVYNLNTFAEISEWCRKNRKSYLDYAEKEEGKEITRYLHEIWAAMKSSVQKGIKTKGTLPGSLKLTRKAHSYYTSSLNEKIYKRVRLFAYTLAVSEENAAGGRIVTAPTCGSCGVLPGVLFFCHERYGFSDKEIIKALATAGFVGNVMKQNGSISGAEVGCQGEIGTACAMAAAAAAELFGANPTQIDYAAEMGIEHHLGMTCDPVEGLVQIPCIERNALAAGRALDCAGFALAGDGSHRISYDDIIKTMLETGKDLPACYRETAKGGLAKTWRQKNMILCKSGKCDKC
ncbi:MAG: L-serine ammonia-lyase [Nanoarchaeota archaeon]|nr:L-serine ammonia-lyase [Nanoarchaeota archaeon]